MPKQFHPQKRGAHRIACIALYRALLSKCSRIEVPASLHRGKIHPIKFIVRKQFRRNAHVESAPYVVAALKLGYEAEELLHTASTGDEAAHSKILELLRGVQAQGDAGRAENATKPPLPPPPKRPISAPYPGAPRLLDQRPRPKSEITGIRRVPKIVCANSIPFLRIKKPQPLFLSRVLGDKIKLRQRRLDRVNRMEDLSLIGKVEQQWDDMTGMADRVSWQTAAEKEKEVVKESLYQTSMANGVLAKKMLAIVDEEQRLADLERKDFLREKRKKRRHAKREEVALEGDIYK